MICYSATGQCSVPAKRAVQGAGASEVTVEVGDHQSMSCSKALLTCGGMLTGRATAFTN
jgi:hypothetical protein